MAKIRELTKGQKKYIGLLLKVLIFASASWYIYSKVSDPANISKFQLLMQGLPKTYLYTIVAVVIGLMFVNWILEVFKWQFLVQKLEKISFWKAFQSVFCGLSWAIFTPNRIGEYGGRVLFLKSQHRAKGAVAMGVGLFAQLVLTSVAGAFSIAWFVSTYLSTPISVQFGIWILAAIYATGFLVLYFNVNWFDVFVGKFKFLKRVKPFFSILEDFSRTELMKVMLLSVGRFLIFTSQYVILMEAILPEIPFMPMVFMIFILFFVQAALPTLDIFDFSVRSFVASNLYQYITNQEIAVMAIVSAIWFVNLILPAILGSVFVFKINFFDNGKS